MESLEGSVAVEIGGRPVVVVFAGVAGWAAEDEVVWVVWAAFGDWDNVVEGFSGEGF